MKTLECILVKFHFFSFDIVEGIKGIILCGNLITFRREH